MSLAFSAEAVAGSSLTVEVTDSQIPYEKLGPTNPIKYSAMLYLFECDLEDCGYVMSQIRFRAMGDSWFLLLRFYLRVDGVCVRHFDTRLYHEFGTNYVLREFKHLEADFNELAEAGFRPSTEWILSATQADEVAQFTTERLKINEKISW